MRALCGRVGDVCTDACVCTCVGGGGEGGGSEGGGGEGCGGAVVTVFGRRGWCVFGRVRACTRAALVGVGDGGGDGVGRCVVTCVVRVRTLCVRRASDVVRVLCTRCTCVVRVAYVYRGGSGGRDRVRGGCIEVVSSCEKIASGFTARLHWRLHWSCIVTVKGLHWVCILFG